MMDLMEIFENVMGHTKVQGEQLDSIEANLTAAAQQVHEGTSELIDASKMRSRFYPVVGAVVGGVIAGPVGLWVGLKVAGLTAVAGAGLGTLAGSYLKGKEASEAERLGQLHATSGLGRRPRAADKKHD
jgi:outer membrane lipoprotein SlyB